ASTYTFTGNDFLLSDPFDSPQNSLAGVKITALDLNGGALKFNNVDVTVGQTIPASGAISLASGALKFTPGASGAIFPNGGFSFQVQDNGLTANGGQDLSVAYDITFNTPPVVVNHAPSDARSTIDVDAAANQTSHTRQIHVRA